MALFPVQRKVIFLPFTKALYFAGFGESDISTKPTPNTSARGAVRTSAKDVTWAVWSRRVNRRMAVAIASARARVSASLPFGEGRTPTVTAQAGCARSWAAMARSRDTDAG